MKAICASILVLFYFQVNGQLLQNLKKAAGDKAKNLASKDNLNKAGSKASDMMFNSLDKSRAEFDSADFDYAILISDNSGLFDVKDKGEGVAKISSAASITRSALKNAELTDEENARFKRQSGE